MNNKQLATSLLLIAFVVISTLALIPTTTSLEMTICVALIQACIIAIGLLDFIAKEDDKKLTSFEVTRRNTGEVTHIVDAETYDEALELALKETKLDRYQFYNNYRLLQAE